MKIKKLDYIIIYVIVVMFFAWNLVVPAKSGEVVSCLVIALISSLVLGTITNLVRLIFKKLNS